jgi:Glycosyl transferases group 1
VTNPQAAAVLLNYPPARFIGAELATHALLRTLQDRDWDIRVLLHTPPAPGTTHYDRIHIRPLRQVTATSVTSGGYPAPDDAFLLTHSYISPALLQPIQDARARFKTPIVLYAHSSRDHTKQAISLINPDLIIPNSHTTAHALDLPMHTTVHPPLNLPASSEYALAALISAAPRPRRAGYVNSTEIKGGELLRDLARAHQGRKSPNPLYTLHAITGGYGEQLAPAAEQVPHRQMAARYYNQIGVHLQPSQSESYGLTALEALSYGVPVISSDLPGPREALKGVPSRFIHWMPPQTPTGKTFTAVELDLRIRYVLSLPPPTPREARRLAVALRRTSAAAATERSLAEQRLRSLYAHSQ